MGEKNGSLIVLAIVATIGLLALPILSGGIEGLATGVTEKISTLIPS